MNPFVAAHGTKRSHGDISVLLGGKMKIKASRLALAAAGVAAFGAASASTLGGLTSTSVGSNDTVVAACDSDGISIAYTTGYAASASKYQVTAVTLSGIHANCANQTAAVTVKNASGASLGSGSVTVSGTSASISLSTPADAEALAGASVVISG
jgi:hypothetical protein